MSIRATLLSLAAACTVCVGAQFAGAVVPRPDTPLPRIVQKDGRYALFVDGAPYLILGAQVNNSSAWPGMLPKVWPAMATLHVNTVEMPVYWEQMEPQPGHFDFSLVDTLLQQARAHRVHLILLWFGTWKNGSGHYQPEWMKRVPSRYLDVVGANGQWVDSPSPHAPATLAADIRAFTALMRHLKAADPQHTVIMVQVENEPGTWGSVRDFSPAAQKLFDGPVPTRLLTALGKIPTTPAADWREVFGEDADEFFHAWSVASYIGKVAAAGKAVNPLPLYVNVALRDPLAPIHYPPQYESGGATDNVIPIWKVAAPAVDLLAPDIYMDDSERYLRVLDLYHRPDNALLVPETGGSDQYARYFFAALGHQAIGFSPFGLDYTNASTNDLSAAAARLAPFAANYAAFSPMDREIARLNFAGRIQADVEQTGTSPRTLTFGRWNATVSYGAPRFGMGGPPPGNPQPVGCALVARLSTDEFLVTGFSCRVAFRPTGSDTGKPWQFIRVEEGQYQNGAWKPVRIWNGDQTDYGLNFGTVPTVLRVSLSTR